MYLYNCAISVLTDLLPNCRLYFKLKVTLLRQFDNIHTMHRIFHLICPAFVKVMVPCYTSKK